MYPSRQLLILHASTFAYYPGAAQQRCDDVWQSNGHGWI
jgi:hypothetical protein